MAILLNPRVWIALGCAAVLAFVLAFTYRAGKAVVRNEFDAYKLAVQAQAEAMREARAQTARDAAQKESVRTVTRTVYITRKGKDLDREIQPLAACPIPVGAVRVLNDIARCAREDRPSTCGVDDAVPRAR